MPRFVRRLFTPFVVFIIYTTPYAARKQKVKLFLSLFLIFFHSFI